MKTLRRLLYILACLLVLTSCEDNTTKKGSEEVNTQPEKNGINSETLTSSLIQEKSENKQLHFEYTIENKTGKTINLTFNSGQKFDYILKDQQGRIIKQDSKGKAYTQAIIEKELKQGARLSYDIYLKDLEPGEYTLEAWLTSSSEKSNYKEKIQFVVK